MKSAMPCLKGTALISISLDGLLLMSRRMISTVSSITRWCNDKQVISNAGTVG